MKKNRDCCIICGGSVSTFISYSMPVYMGSTDLLGSECSFEDMAFQHCECCGSGSIFKRDTFAQIYPRFRSFVELNFDVMQSIYPTVGWTDCINSLAMMMVGKKHTISSQVYELGQWGQDHSGRNYDGVEERLKDKHSILHHYKKYY